MAVTVPFTRAGPGTYTDSNGILQTAPADTLRLNYSGPPHTNRCLWSRDLTNAVWILNGAAAGLVAQNEVGLDNVTLNTATTLTDNTATFFVGRSQVFAVPNDSNTHIVGVWIKKDNDTSRFPEVAMSLSGGVAQNNKAQLNTRTGATALRASTGTHPFGSTDAGLWWIFWVSVINNGTGNTVLTLDIYPARTAIIGSANVAAVGSIIIGNVEVEFNTTAITGALFTTNAIVTGNADSAVLYEPNPATNVMLWVEQYDNAIWTKRGTCIVTPNAVIAPDGTLTADQISGVALAGNDIFQAVSGLIPSARYEPSFWLQRVSTVGTIQFTNPATTASGDWRIDLSLLNNGWNWITRSHPAVTVVVEFTGHSTSVCGHFFRALTASVISFNVWHAQLELGTVSTSSIVPVTTNAPVTRAADIDSMLSAVAGGYSRQNGNFITEGFVPGMSIATTGFSFTPPSSVITKVSATSIAQSGQRIPEAVAPGRSLTGTVVARGSGIYGTSQSTIDLSAFPEDRTGVTNA